MTAPDWQIAHLRSCRWCGKRFVRPPDWPWICSTPACYARCAAFGIRNRDNSWRWLPVPLQAEIMEAKAPRRPLNDQITRVLVGGAAGASKSHGSRWGAYWFALKVPRCRILLLREVAAELERSHILGLMDTEAPDLGADFRTHPYPLARWANGSFIEGGHMEDAVAVKRYLSSEYDLIIPEEASLYNPDSLMELSSRARTSNPAMLELGGARVWYPTNPGGPSSDLLRTLFLDREIDADEWPSLAEDYDPREWMTVLGRVDDNPWLDPSYERNLAGLRQQWRYKQLRFGDWYAVQGLFFDKFSQQTHVRDYVLSDPSRLPWFRSLDWGYHDKAVMHWWTVLDDGELHVAGELVFRQKTPTEINPRVQSYGRELGLHPEREIPTHASPDMWGKRGQSGEYIWQEANRLKWKVRQANTDREAGWMRLLSLLAVVNGRPGLTLNSRCRYAIRSLLTARSDEHNPNDVDGTDDHALESLRYGAMSRPKPRDRSRDVRIGEWDADFRPPAPLSVGASQR